MTRQARSPKPLWRLVCASAAVLALTASCRAEPSQQGHSQAPALADAAGVSRDAAAAVPGARPPLGVMGTIPIYWGEAGDLGDLLAGGTPHWARTVLEARYSLHPLDTLDAAALAGQTHLLLAQPRALSPQENVDLDAWVRAGGHLLLFADPLLTGESHFALGDRRRPQDVILLSPLLHHWGLALEFDEDQPGGVRLVQAGDLFIPVKLPGRIVVVAAVNSAGGAVHPESEVPRKEAMGVEAATPIGENAGQACRLEAEAVLAICAIGRGKAWIFADAALLDLHHPHPGSAQALSGLVAKFSGK